MTLFWDIVPGEVCNFYCLTCYAADNARPDLRVLDWPEMKKALDRVISLNIKDIYLLGGEPLMYRDIEKFIGYFKSKVKDGFCGIVTNGSLVTKEKARSLINAGLDLFNFSIDGTTAEINDLNRGKGTFELIMDGIENAKAVGMPFVIGYTITPFNTLDTVNLFPFVQRIVAKALSIQITEKSGRAIHYFKEWNYIEGLKAICRMYQYRPPFYVTVTPKKLFVDFLNYFFNAGLNQNEAKSAICNGGLTMAFVSSGGDLFPCAEYAYSRSNGQVRRGVNLVSDNFDVIEAFVNKDFTKFNKAMRLLAKTKFTTCKSCKYIDFCSPCPLSSAPGVVPECEWVKMQTNKLKGKVLNSQIKLLIKPQPINDSKISFSVTTQKQPLIINTSSVEFQKLIDLQEVSAIVNIYKLKNQNIEQAEYKVIELLCKLRSHKIVEIEGFDIE
ncbi:MAG: radical SAM protein [Caldiserica bacterium]|nr:radical SAM protein [Caldisericota bacterium]